MVERGRAADRLTRSPVKLRFFGNSDFFLNGSKISKLCLEHTLSAKWAFFAFFHSENSQY